MPDFTQEQAKAISMRGGDLLLSAAAGSGKTSVLVQRVVGVVTDRARPVDISRLLVVTFTDAAAAEMRERVRAAIDDLLADDPGNAYLRRQQSQLADASIMTIHGFCLRVLRQFFHVADLDPLFVVADETEAEILKHDVLNELLEDAYLRDDPVFLELVEIYGGSVTDDALGSQIIRLHDFAESDTSPKQWLERAGAEDLSPDAVRNAPWYRLLTDDMRDILEDALDAAQRALILAGTTLLHDKYLIILATDVDNVEKCLAALDDGWDALRLALDFEFDRLVAPKVKNLSEDEQEQAAAIIRQISDLREDVKAVKTLRERYIQKPFDNMMTDLNMSQRATKCLCDLAAEFSERFAAAKRARNLLDFGDLEHECLKILRDDQSPAAAELSARYDEIFVDEYQDSNAVQELILACVSGHRRNRFMVGDVKQGIYRFRLADPEIFEATREALGRDRVVALSTNFRSRRAVLDAANFVFKRIMSKKLGGTDYGENERLHFGAAYGDDEERHLTELLCVQTDGSGADEREHDEDLTELSNTELEAAAAANYLRGLLDSKFTISGKDGPRPIEPSDVAILLRSPRNLSEIYIEALKNQGIAAESDVGQGYFESPEVLTALSFLRVIDNPKQDIPLAAALYSRVYGLTASELFWVRRSCDARYLYDAALWYAENGDGEARDKLARFFADLRRWRELAARERLSALLWTVLEDSTLFLLEGAMPGGALRQANLRALHAYAVGYEKTRMRGLFNFIRFIDKIMETGKDHAFRPAREEISNAVRIMSIHKSKGLEFPVVMVCGLGRKFNLQDVQARLLFHKDLGIGAKAFDMESRVISDTPKRLAISAKLRQESISEELRILYVAMTRAREKLILTGIVKPGATHDAHPGTQLPYRLLKKNNCYMDFLLQALAGRNAPVRIINQSPASPPAAQADTAPKKSLYVENSDYRLADKLFYEYPHALAAKIPRKLSVTEVKRLYYSEQIRESGQILEPGKEDLPEPAFMGSKSLGAAARGTVFHIILERLPMELNSAAQVAAFIASLVDAKFLSPAEAALVNVTKIAKFLDSPLAGRIRAADRLWREQNFILSVPAADINPAWSAQPGHIMVHGIIDCVISEGGRLTLIDYKTGRFTDPATEMRRYRPQMTIYARAVAEHFGREVDDAIMYYFDNGQTLGNLY